MQGIVNRDIKLENTLLDGSRRPLLKICDFGYSKHEKDSLPKSKVGTPGYTGERFPSVPKVHHNPALAVPGPCCPPSVGCDSRCMAAQRVSWRGKHMLHGPDWDCVGLAQRRRSYPTRSTTTASRPTCGPPASCSTSCSSASECAHECCPCPCARAHSCALVNRVCPTCCAPPRGLMFPSPI